MASNICSKCSTPNLASANFCANCGERLDRISDHPDIESTGQPALKTGTILQGRYQIELELGRGGFGAVYKARDMSLSKDCAIKENLSTTEFAQRQFSREATVLAKLNHPNLPRVTDHFIIPGQGQYLVMDFIEGLDLKRLFEINGVVAPEQAIQWITQIADALSYLHSQNPPILHRDIKPANIRVTPEGRVYLVDFGLVKHLDPHQKTTIGARAITPGYSPPEQYGEGITDERSDIYALAATLYTLLTGIEPPESVQRVGYDNLQTPNQVNIQVNQSLSNAITRAMALQPQQRFSSVNQFKTAITTQIPDSSLPTQPSTTGQKKTPYLLIAAGFGGLLICVFSIALIWSIYGDQLFGLAKSSDTSTPTRTPDIQITDTPISPTDTSETVIIIDTTQVISSEQPMTETPTFLPTAAETDTPTPTISLTPTPTISNTPTQIPKLVFDLAFASDRTGLMQIHLMNTQNTSEWTSINNPSGYNRVWWPTFCGSQIAVEAQDLNGVNPTWIYMLDPSTDSAWKWLPTAEWDRLAVPRCSPDNQFLAFSGNAGSSWDMLVAENQSMQVKYIYTTSLSGYASWPGDTSLFYSMGRPDKTFDIRRTVNIQNPEQMTTSTIIGEGKFPAISPDNALLAYVCNGTSEICVIEISSGITLSTIPLNYVKIDGVAMPASMMWSGDGQWLYYASADGGDWDIFRIRYDGSGKVNLTSEWSSNELMPAILW